MLVTSVEVQGPFGSKVAAKVAWGGGAHWKSLGISEKNRVCAFDLASCSGISLVPKEKRNPLFTTSYGLGELLIHAAEGGASVVVVGLGGSATVDGGLGLLQSLGANISGVCHLATGGELQKCKRIDLSALHAGVRALKIIVASDVRNPLLGTRGAARAFGPQKGASPPVVDALEIGMAEYARILCAASSPTVEAVTAMNRPGAGAAGGIGFCLNVALGAEIHSGIDFVMDALRFDEALADVDVVLTGEGRFDESSFEGKVISGVVERAQRQNKPLCVITGTSPLTESDWVNRGILKVLRLRDYAEIPQDTEVYPEKYLEMAARTLAESLAYPGA
jgi:glycerate kinase